MQAATSAGSKHATRASLLLLLGVSVFVSASAALQNRKGALWIAESGGVLNISTDSDEIRFEISHALGVSGIAVNDINGELWAYGKKRLYHYTRDGQPLLEVDALPSTHGGDPVDMVVDGAAGNLWLAIQRDLYRFDFQGQLQQTIALPRTVVALGLDRFRSRLWVAMGQELRIYDLDGVVIRAVALGQKDSTSDLAYDRVLDQVWVNFADRLRRYDHAGDAVLEIAGNFSGSISPDGARGLWRSDATILEHISEMGHADFSVEPFFDNSGGAGFVSELAGKQIVDLAADPQDASVWVASPRRIRHYAPDGTLLRELTPETEDGVIRKLYRSALYADLDPPEIQITAPAGGSMLNQSRPLFGLHYFDLGVGVDPDTIAFTVNGQPIAVSCDSSPARASCTPDSALPEGEVQIGARVADSAGNVSEPGELSITIDRIPPEITVTQPSLDHITNQPGLAIHGNLNEPGTLTINGASVDLSGSVEFVHHTQLDEGGNTFELTALDRAGNQAHETLHVILDPVPPMAPVRDLITISSSQQGEVQIAGAAGSVEPGSNVIIINVRTGKSVTVTAAADGSFQAVIEAESGDELSIVAVDAASNTSGESRVQVPGSRELTISEPLDGATVETVSVLVAGSVGAPLNTAITLNGAPVTVQHAGGMLQFYASVPLAIGQNTLVVTANLQDGRTLAKAVTVTRVPADITVRLVPHIGAIPLVTQYAIDGTRRADQLRFDFDGDGQADLVRAGLAFGVVVTNTHSVAGLYHPTVEVLKFNSSTQMHEPAYKQTFSVAAVDPKQTRTLDLILRSIWEGMNAALLAGDIPKALTALSPSSRDAYRQIFEALGPQVADFVNESGAIQPIEFSTDIADYAVRNVHGGSSKVFIVNFIQGPDGVWHIDSM